MTHRCKDPKRRGQPSPGAPTGLFSDDPDYIWYDPNKGKPLGEKKSSYKARWVTLKDSNRLHRERVRSAQARLCGRIKSRKLRYTPKGLAFKKLTDLVYKLCTLLKAPQRRGGVPPVYHEPEMSVRYFWGTIDALLAGKQTWYQHDRSQKGSYYAHVRHPEWPKIERAIDEIETLIWSWGFHRLYSVWTLWLNEGEKIKNVVQYQYKSDPDGHHDRIQKLIDALPATPDVDDEYRNMPLTEKE